MQNSPIGVLLLLDLLAVDYLPFDIFLCSERASTMLLFAKQLKDKTFKASMTKL